MKYEDSQHIDSLLTDFTWYARTFLQTGTGMEWDSIGGRDYFATVWMEFFKGIRDGTYQRLAEAISDPAYIPYFRDDVQDRLRPLLAELEAMTLKKGKQKIKAHINVEKFGLYGAGLKQMSRDNIVFDIIQDDDDIRGTYFIDEDPSLIRSYLTAGIRNILNEYGSAERRKIRELEGKLKELESELQEKNTLFAVQDSRRRELAQTVNEQQNEISAIAERNRKLEEILLEYIKEEEEANEAAIDPSSPIENGRLRLYFFHKLGFLDKTLWKDKITYEQMGKILQKILGGKPIKADTAARDAKLFNSTGSSQLKQYEADNEHKVLNYLKSICPDLDFPEGKSVNEIMRRKGNI